MSYFSNGDRIQFAYYGGSNYGKTRHVKVTKVTPKFVEGVDEHEGKYKKFSKVNMGNVKVLPSLSLAQELVELQAFLNKHPNYAKSLISEFNDKHKVQYEFKNGYISQVNISSSKTLYSTLVKNNNSVVLTTKTFKVEVKSTGYVYINGIFCGIMPNLYKSLSSL